MSDKDRDDERRKIASSDYRHGIERGLSRARDIVNDLCRCNGVDDCIHEQVARSITDEIHKGGR